MLVIVKIDGASEEEIITLLMLLFERASYLMSKKWQYKQIS